MSKQLAFEKIGFGVLEPNKMPHAEYGGNIVADVAMNVEDVKKLGNRVENGTILSVEYGKGFKNNLKKGEVRIPTADSNILGIAYAENKIYSEFHSKKDFALFVENPTIGQVKQMPYYDNVKYGTHDLHETVVPRIFLFGLGDIFTTNLIDTGWEDLTEGDKCYTSVDGYISKDGAIKKVEFTVVQKTTMPDGQNGIKFAVTKLS